MNKTLSGVTILGQSGPGSNEGGVCIPQISKAGALPSDDLMSYKGQLLKGGCGGLTPLQRCSQCILQPQPTGLGILIVFNFSGTGKLILNILY